MILNYDMDDINQQDSVKDTDLYDQKMDDVNQQDSEPEIIKDKIDNIPIKDIQSQDPGTTGKNEAEEIKDTLKESVDKTFNSLFSHTTPQNLRQNTDIIDSGSKFTIDSPMSNRYTTSSSNEKKMDPYAENDERSYVENVDSTAIQQVGYDPETKELQVKFVGGDKVYSYPNVPEEDIEQFLNAPSKGRDMAYHIKPNFSVPGYRGLGAKPSNSSKINADKSSNDLDKKIEDEFINSNKENILDDTHGSSSDYDNYKKNQQKEKKEKALKNMLKKFKGLDEETMLNYSLPFDDHTSYSNNSPASTGNSHLSSLSPIASKASSLKQSYPHYEDDNNPATSSNIEKHSGGKGKQLEIPSWKNSSKTSVFSRLSAQQMNDLNNYTDQKFPEQEQIQEQKFSPLKGSSGSFGGDYIKGGKITIPNQAKQLLIKIFDMVQKNYQSWERDGNVSKMDFGDFRLSTPDGFTVYYSDDNIKGQKLQAIQQSKNGLAVLAKILQKL